MAKAIRFHQTGGPEVLRLEDVAVGDPGPGEARVRHAAVGVNFVDIYHRTGLYPLPLPSGIGVEGAGIVEAVGAGVAHVRAGDRVGYMGPPGAYAEARLIAADRLVKLPAEIDDRTAASAVRTVTEIACPRPSESTRPAGRRCSGSTTSRSAIPRPARPASATPRSA